MRFYRIAVAAAISALTVLASASSLADTIITKSRQTFTGRILEDTPQQIVIKTESGTVTVPRASIAILQKDVQPDTVKIVPDRIRPSDAPKAYENAKAAVAKGDWLKAGNLLSGLMELPPTVFPHENRLAATAALATCYLQIKDPKGSARTFALRSGLVCAEGDKRRLLATAEALDKIDVATPGVLIGGQAVASYDEAIAAAMTWKVNQILADAKDLGVKATDLNDMVKLNAAAKRCTAKLDDAELYAPGFSAAHRAEVLATLADNIMDAARKAAQQCTEERTANVSRYWRTSVADVKTATIYNIYVTKYLGRRQAAEEGLKNLKTLSSRYDLPQIYADRTKEHAALLAQLDELQYHEMLPGMPQKLRITLRRIGSGD
jgi:hypothetical protein